MRSRTEDSVNRSLLESVLRRVGPLSADGHVPDAELLRRFISDRDETAFAALVRRHGPLVWSVCRHLLPHEPDAEDVFQATFLALVQNAAAVRNPAALGSWLHGVAYRVAQKAKRTAARRHRRERVAASHEAAEPVSQRAWDELRAAVHEEVGWLPEPLRTAFVLCDLEGAAQPEAAAALGWKLGTLSGRLSKARQLLLSRLAERGVPAATAVTGAVVVGAALVTAPPKVLADAVALARSGVDLVNVASATVFELARGATEVSMTRPKIITAVILTAFLAAGTATALLPPANAQRPIGPQPGNNDPGGPPGDSNGPHPGSMGGGFSSGSFNRAPAAHWEYKFVPRKSDSLEDFEHVLNEYAAAGWEFCGVESLKVTDPARRKEWGTNPTIVFKRPKPSARGFGGGLGGGMSGYGGSSSGGGGFSGAGGSGAAPFGGQSNHGSGQGQNAPGTEGSLPLSGQSGPSTSSSRGGMAGHGPGISGPGPGLGGPRGGGIVGSGPGPGMMGPGLGGGMSGLSGLSHNPGPGAQGAPADVTVIRLSNASATGLAVVLSQLFQERNCRVIAEPATNTLLVQCDPTTLKALTEVVQKIDTPPNRPAVGPGGAK